MVKIRITMKDQFSGVPITGYLAANSAGPVVQLPEEMKFKEFKMQYYWRVEEYLDGFVFVNRWQTVSRYIGLSKKEEYVPATTVKLPDGRSIRVAARNTIVFKTGWWENSISSNELLPFHLNKK